MALQPSPLPSHGLRSFEIDTIDLLENDGNIYNGRLSPVKPFSTEITIFDAGAAA
jgi:hypothetical protein